MEPKEQDTQQQTLPTPENAVESENPMRHSHMNKAMEHQARRNIIYAVAGWILCNYFDIIIAAI